jgi:hypothetical protein
LHEFGGWIVLKNHEDLSFEIYDITDIETPWLINTIHIDNEYEWIISYCTIDDNDPDLLYIFSYFNSNFRKYDISETGNPIMLFEYELPSIPNSLVVINSNIYFTESSSENSYNLHIISGLDINEPYQANEIPNFTSNEYLNSQCGFLVTHNLNYNSVAQIYQLDNPVVPELYFTPTWGERIEIKENLVFAIADFIIGVYELGASSSEPLAVFNGLSYTYNIHLTEHEGTKYLITNEMNNIGLFEYTYSPSSADDEIPETKFALSNYPNPFNPETIIEFNLPEETEASLKIYNLKGQLVTTLINEMLQKGRHKIQWNGNDSEGNAVSSGLYFYQLKSNRNVFSRKMLLLK